MTSVMPLVSRAARSSEGAARSRDLIMPSQPFFDSTTQSSWITPATVPPAGAWQLAPAGLSNPFAFGAQGLDGDAVYSTRDRKMTSGDGPIVVAVQVVRISGLDENDRLITAAQSKEPRLLRAGTMCRIVQKPTDPRPQVELVINRDPSKGYRGFVASDTFWEPGDINAGMPATSVPIVVQGATDVNGSFADLKTIKAEGLNKNAMKPGVLVDETATIINAVSPKTSGAARFYIH